MEIYKYFYLFTVAARTLYYHGTSLDSAKNIAHFIDLGCGKPCQDFSHKCGFYLNIDEEGARKFAKNSRTHENKIPAVVIFKEPRNLHEYCGLNLSDDENDWKDIIRYNRSGQSIFLEERNESIYRNYEKCDYIVGPMYERTFRINKNKWTWTTSPDGFHNSYRQLCIKSEKLANEFSKNIFDIICFESDEWESVEIN